MSKFSKSKIKLNTIFPTHYAFLIRILYLLILLAFLLGSYFSIYQNIIFKSLIISVVVFISLINSFIFFYKSKKNLIFNILLIVFSLTVIIFLYSDRLNINDIIIINKFIIRDNLYEIYLYIVSLYFLYLSIKEFPKDILAIYFKTIFNYKAYKVKNHDFFTNEVDFIFNEEIKKQKDGVFFFITPIEKIFKDEEDEKKSKKKHKKLIEKFTELAFFWYVYKFDLVKFRATLPILAFLLSVIFFIYTLFLLDSLDITNNVLKMSFVVMFSIVLYYSLLIHINKFLNPEYYLESIFKIFEELNINFPKNITNDQKVILFLDKTFLINVYNASSKEFFSLNENKEFIKFVLSYYLDKEGRDYIMNIFVSIFMVIYITIFVTVLVDSETDKFIKDHNDILIKILKRKY